MKLIGILILGLLSIGTLNAADSILEIRLNDISRDAIPPVTMNPGPLGPISAADSAVCPTCQVRIHVPGFVEYARKIRAWRELEYNVRIDISGFCGICSKRDKDDKSLPFCYIVVTHPDNTIVRTPITHRAEMAMLDAFFNGDDTFTGPDGKTVALRRYIGNLRQFLGIPVKRDTAPDILPPIVDTARKDAKS